MRPSRIIIAPLVFGILVSNVPHAIADNTSERGVTDAGTIYNSSAERTQANIEDAPGRDVGQALHEAGNDLRAPAPAASSAPTPAPSGGSSDVGMGGAGGCAGGNISDVSTCLNQYKPKGTLSVGDGSLSGGGGVKAKIVAIANRVIVIVAIVAIGAIVMAGFHMVTAYGDDEKHKKGKEALKWGIIGFATSLVSFALVNAVINFLYNIG